MTLPTKTLMFKNDSIICIINYEKWCGLLVGVVTEFSLTSQTLFEIGPDATVSKRGGSVS